MNPFGATLVLLLTARDAKRFAAQSAPRSRSKLPHDRQRQSLLSRLPVVRRGEHALSDSDRLQTRLVQ